VQFDWQVFREFDEVRVRGEDPHPVSHGHGADHQVGSGALDPFAAASVIVGGGVFVILLVQREIRIEPQVFLELLEVFLRLRAREDFLPDAAQHLHRVVPNQSCHLDAKWVIALTVAPQKAGPDAGVHDDGHGLPRIFL